MHFRRGWQIYREAMPCSPGIAWQKNRGPSPRKAEGFPHSDAAEPPAHSDAAKPPAHSDAAEPPAHSDAAEPPAHSDAAEPQLRILQIMAAIRKVEAFVAKWKIRYLSAAQSKGQSEPVVKRRISNLIAVEF